MNRSPLRHLVVLLVVLGHASVWSTPCPPAAGPAESAVRVHALPAPQAAPHRAEHPAAHLDPADPGAAGAAVVAPCSGCCNARPRAGGLSLSPGWALVAPTLERLGQWTAEPVRTGEPVPQSTPADLLDHVPILFS